MRKPCVTAVDGLGLICVKFMGFYPAMIYIIRGVEKRRSFTTGFSWFLHSFFHPENLVFQSVNRRVLPTFNIVNNNDNKVILNFNSYWRILV